MTEPRRPSPVLSLAAHGRAVRARRIAAAIRWTVIVGFVVTAGFIVGMVLR